MEKVHLIYFPQWQWKVCNFFCLFCLDILLGNYHAVPRQGIQCSPFLFICKISLTMIPNHVFLNDYSEKLFSFVLFLFDVINLLKNDLLSGLKNFSN